MTETQLYKYKTSQFHRKKWAIILSKIIEYLTKWLRVLIVIHLSEQCQGRRKYVFSMDLSKITKNYFSSKVINWRYYLAVA